MNFFVDEVRLPDGRAARREFMDHPGAVGVLPFIDRETIVLVRQYRYPVRRLTHELPAGKLDRGESPRACVRRELREETGYDCRRLRSLLSYWPTAAFSDEILHLYVADGLVPADGRPDDDEFLEAERVPYRRALQWVFSGKIRDSKTIIALLAYSLIRPAG